MVQDSKETKIKELGFNLFEYHGTDVYRVDLECHTCTCTSWWIGHHKRNNGLRNCKHLDEIRQWQKGVKK